MSLSCKKDEQEQTYSSIPNVTFDIRVNLNEPSSYAITNIGGWIYLDGGSRGLIVYRTASEFIAYERHTPYQSDLACAFVAVDSTNVYAIDKCSQSRYLLLDGSVAEGKATIPLKRYRTSVFSDVLRIYN